MSNSPIRVAIVDDDESIRRAMRRLLLSAGVESECYSGGEEFLQALAQCRPDCLLLDVRMPDMTGEEVLERLVELGEPLPVIIITAHDQEGARLRGAFKAVVAVQYKPINDRALLHDIEAACAHSNT